jgi:hypothetical protein
MFLSRTGSRILRFSGVKLVGNVPPARFLSSRPGLDVSSLLTKENVKILGIGSIAGFAGGVFGVYSWLF